jgi:hypothetical protein
MKPNFFIVGAGKSGTTALYSYLKKHPRVFLPEKKEPHYFTIDRPGYRKVRTETEYLELFSKANSEHIAIGEASVSYLKSADALSEIAKFNPKAKIIIMIRNHIERAPSLHNQLLYKLEEDVVDFKTAYNLQDERKKGKYIPVTCTESFLLNYTERVRLYKDLERVYQVFPKEQVKIIFFDDFKKDVEQVYLDVLNFLGLEDVGYRNFEKINERKKLKSRSLKKLMQFRFKNKLIPKIFVLLGGKRLKLKKRINRMNTKSEEKNIISFEMKAKLAQDFKEDIDLLSQQTGRDLSGWYKKYIL